MNSKRGRLVLYSGCSGVGKGTILRQLMERDPNIRLSVSNTTRAPREGEIDGVHYNFVTRDQFLELARRNGYYEYAEYCGNLYGTPCAPVEEMLENGNDVFLEIEVQGGLQIMERFPEVLSIFVLPPSLEELGHRLRGRGTETEEVVQKRLAEAENELKIAPRYKYNVVNDRLEDAVEDILSILHNEKQ